MFFTGLSKRGRYLLFIAGAAIIFIFFNKIIFAPITALLSGLNKQILIYEKKLEKATLMINREDSIISEYEKNIQNLKKAYSDEEEISILSSEIEKLARGTSVLIKNIKPLPLEDRDLYIEYRINIEAEAAMPFLIDFIYQLENSQQLLKVNKFILSPIKKGSSTLKASLLITNIRIP